MLRPAVVPINRKIIALVLVLVMSGCWVKNRNNRNSLFSRRTALQIQGSVSVAVPLAGGIGVMFSCGARALGQSGDPHRLIQIFLPSDWDSIESTDPVLESASEALGGNFAPPPAATIKRSDIATAPAFLR